MAASFTHNLQKHTGDPTVIVGGGTPDMLQFASGDFNGKITVDAYNDSTHVKDDGGLRKSTSNENNNKWIDDNQVEVVKSGGDKETKDFDDAEAGDRPTTGEAALKITFASGNGDVETENGKFFAYDGTTKATAPVGMTVLAAEQGQTADWKNIGGEAAALALQDKSVAGATHDFFVFITAKPTAVGAKTGKYWIELDYS